MVASVLVAFLHQRGMFKVANVPIEVTLVAQSSSTTVGAAGLKKRLSKVAKSAIGKKIWSVDLREMRAAVVKDEWVKDVFISRTFPNGIKIKVEPKQTVSILVGSRGALWPVTDDASILSKLPADAVPDVPLLRGEIFLKDTDRLKNAVHLVTSLPANGPISKENVSEITWNKESGYSLVLMHPRIEVRLGDEKLDLKIVRVAQVVNYMNNQGVSGAIIDASFSKKVLVRVRKGP